MFVCLVIRNDKLAYWAWLDANESPCHSDLCTSKFLEKMLLEESQKQKNKHLAFRRRIQLGL